MTKTQSGIHTGMRRKLTRYGDEEFALFLRKSFIKAMGYTDDALQRPVVGIVNTASGFNACHRNVPDIIDAIKRGVMFAGGLPIDFPVISLHESFAYPTSMFLRNLMSMDVEEMIRGLPLDAVVLVGGCDKTVPALLMGAASADVPAIVEVSGPMSPGSHRGERVAACTDCRRFWARFRAGEIDAEEIDEVNSKLAPTAGFCGVMGTASTMACMAEALGMMLPGGAIIPAVAADRLRNAERTGQRAVALCGSDLTPSRIMTKAAFDNALCALHAIGGSTNALVHLTAVAGRLGIQIDLDHFHSLGQDLPVLVDVKPSGRFYMDDFHFAGGLNAVLKQIDKALNQQAMTITGDTLGQNIAAQPAFANHEVVRSIGDPLYAAGGMATLRGNLAPDGAVIKQSAASSTLMQHEGRAVVFESLGDLAERVDSPELDVNADDILVLKNAGPCGAPGMPEAGYLPIPKKLASQGVKDMVRISDARMSGTAFGTIVLHIAPEAACGGPLALVNNGDRIRLDVKRRVIELLVDDDELAKRKQSWRPPAPHANAERGYLRLFLDHVMQADKGCDFDFLAKSVSDAGD